METTRSATLRIALVSAHAYELLYTIADRRGGATPSYTIQGQEQLQVLLTQLGLTTAEIALISMRVEAGMSYVLDLSHLDRETAEQVLRSFSP